MIHDVHDYRKFEMKEKNLLLRIILDLTKGLECFESEMTGEQFLRSSQQFHCLECFGEKESSIK